MKKSLSIRSLVILLLIIGLHTAVAARENPPKSADKTTAAEPATSPSEEAPQQKKIDQAGEKIGQQVDTLSQKSSHRLGGWINAQVFAGISWLKLILCLALIFIVFGIERFVRAAIDRGLNRRRAGDEPQRARDHLLTAVSRPLSLFITVYGIYFALSPLFIHFRRPSGVNLVHTFAQKTADLVAAVALVWFIFRLMAIVDLHIQRWAERTENTIDNMLAPLVGKTLRVFIIVIGGILILQNLTGVEIGPLLASLGIGGLAVALAARDTIANFFGTLTILFDKPFQVGQRVVLSGYDGVVESVGFRSTRIRTLNGHLLTIPNEKVVNSPVENIGLRPHLRWNPNITLTYDTPPDKVRRAVEVLREILENHEGAHPDFPPRVYFNGFNDWSLNISVMVWYHPPNYWDMQAWQERTCMRILERFNAEGIEFAFPSQTLYLANDDRRQLQLAMLRGTPPGEAPVTGASSR